MRHCFVPFAVIGITSLNLSCHLIRGPVTPQPLKVMSFNIRFNNPDDGANAWPHRKDLVAGMIRFHQADLIGVQEALKDQMNDLSQLLPEFGAIGVGRDDGQEKGEYSGIFYRKNRFALLQQRTFWLSATPEKPGSLGWDAAITRVCTWGQFKDQHTGKLFFLFNTHFDHMGETARLESARLLLKTIQSLAFSAPVIVTGDFNAAENSMVYKILTGSAAGESQSLALRDARYVSFLPSYGAKWSFHGFGKAVERPLIDYVFVNKPVKVLRHGIISEPDPDRYASDHLPVLAEVILE